MSNYWKDRLTESQNRLSNKSRKEIEKQLKKYYGNAAKRIINDFEATYNKLLVSVGNNKNPTPADLYKLDKYWAMQGQLRQELTKLGEKQIAAMTKAFETNFFEVYHSIGIEGSETFNTIDKNAVDQLINQIWVADGKNFSQRVWSNTEKLVETLNEQLLHCVATGKKPSQLKAALMERFNVSYSNADMIARTELAHIQTQAAQQRYKDYGLEQVEIWADPDERTCEICGKLHKQRYPIGAVVPIPAHPRCRCCIVPVVEDSIEEKQERTTSKIEKRERRNREGYKKAVSPQFNDMSKKEVSEWANNNLKANINFNGSSEEAAQITTKALYTLESKGIDLSGLNVAFGKTGSSYGLFSRNTNTLYLRTNSNFVEKMKELDKKSIAKYGKPYYAVSNYEGAVYHELGHALDQMLDNMLSKKIAYNESLYRDAIKVSFYASDRPFDIRANKATETFAENFSAYMAGGDAAQKVPKEVIELIETYLIKK